MTIFSTKKWNIWTFWNGYYMWLAFENTPSVSNIYHFVPIEIGLTKEIGAIIVGAIIDVIGIMYYDLDLCLISCYVNLKLKLGWDEKIT